MNDVICRPISNSRAFDIGHSLSLRQVSVIAFVVTLLCNVVRSKYTYQSTSLPIYKILMFRYLPISFQTLLFRSLILSVSSKHSFSFYFSLSLFLSFFSLSLSLSLFLSFFSLSLSLSLGLSKLSEQNRTEYFIVQFEKNFCMNRKRC